jgi:hypothetical protein
MILLGFAAVCTAGILLPLNWTIGIRLTEEDEIEGLDASGIVIYSIKKKINKIFLVAAHGENWEVAASHAVSALIKKVLQEHANKGQNQRVGTFDLHYKPANAEEHSITIPLSNPDIIPVNQLENKLEQGVEPDAYFQRVN